MATSASSMQPSDFVRTRLNESINNNEDILEDLDHEKENEVESNPPSKRSTTPSIRRGKSYVLMQRHKKSLQQF